MAKDKETTPPAPAGFQAANVTETVRPVIVNDKGEEVTMHEAMATLLNDVAELKKKLIG